MMLRRGVVGMPQPKANNRKVSIAPLGSESNKQIRSVNSLCAYVESH
jgi:hypothetical protein